MFTIERGGVMKRKGILLILLLIILSLTGCSSKDEYGERYNIDNTDIAIALTNDQELTSVSIIHIDYIDYDNEKGSKQEIEYQIDEDTGYTPTFDVYHQMPEGGPLCTIQIDKELGDEYVKHGTISPLYQLSRFPANNVYNFLDSLTFDIEDYEIENGYYRYELPYMEDMYIFLRVNSKNYIDHVKIVRRLQEEDVLLEEMILSGHNNTTVTLPEYTYMTPFEYAEEALIKQGFNRTILSDTERTYSNDVFQTSIDFEAETILFTKDDEQVLYEDSSDSIAIALLLNNENVSDILLLLSEHRRVENGWYDLCGE